MPSITDVPGVEAGHATDREGLTGCTVILCKQGAVAAADIRGGATGTREIDPLSPSHLVPKIHAVLLSGGSAFGLSAAGGAMRWLEERGIGFSVGVANVPIVPTAIIFDLWIGDPKKRPDEAMGYRACGDASASPPEEGSVGAGTGATVGKLLGIDQAMKGGVGSWSASLADGTRVGALSVVNAWGDVLDPKSGKIIAGTREAKNSMKLADSARLLFEGKQARRYAAGNTTLTVVATDARLDKAGAQRVAIMGQDGLARALSPVHSQVDGDVVFALSVGDREADINAVGTLAARVVAESIVRGVTRAKSLGGVPSLSDADSNSQGWE